MTNFRFADAQWDGVTSYLYENALDHRQVSTCPSNDVSDEENTQFFVMVLKRKSEQNLFPPETPTINTQHLTENSCNTIAQPTKRHTRSFYNPIQSNASA